MFPSEYTNKTLPPGYLWNMVEQELYSFKRGLLKKMKLQRPFFNSLVCGRNRIVMSEKHYRLSVNGRKLVVARSELLRLKCDYSFQIVLKYGEEK